MHRWCHNRRRAERQAAEKRKKEELAAEEEKAKAAALFAQNARQQVDRVNIEADDNCVVDGAEEGDKEDDEAEDENQEDAVVAARKVPPRRSTAASAGAPVLQQSPAPPALRPKIFGPGNETALPTPQAPAPAPERNTAVERTAVEGKKADVAAPTSGPTKCLSLPTYKPLLWLMNFSA